MPKHAGADDVTLRNSRLVFYEQDVEKINACLESFLTRSKASCALLIDIEGHLVTQVGFTSKLDTTSIAALVAGSFASTRALAKHLGEKEFSVVFHQGERDSIHIALVGERTLVVIIFDDRTTIGMVRMSASEVTHALSGILTDMEVRGEGDGVENLCGDGDFQEQAGARLDEIFGNE